MNALLKSGAAGLVATAPMTLVMETLFRELPRKITENVLEKTGASDQLNEKEKRGATLAAHFAYGAAAGCLFRPFAARFKGSPLKQGAAFGLGVWTVSYLGMLPILRMHRPATREPWRRNLLMISAHLVWGTLLAEIFSRIKFEVGIMAPLAIEADAVWDIVDQASWESFPASDPPARRA